MRVLVRMVKRRERRAPVPQRGYVIQPSVGAERLRWVADDELKQL